MKIWLTPKKGNQGGKMGKNRVFWHFCRVTPPGGLFRGNVISWVNCTHEIRWGRSYIRTWLDHSKVPKMGFQILTPMGGKFGYIVFGDEGDGFAQTKNVFRIILGCWIWWCYFWVTPPSRLGRIASQPLNSTKNKGLGQKSPPFQRVRPPKFVKIVFLTFYDDPSKEISKFHWF